MNNQNIPGVNKASFKSYGIGFFISIITTIFPFYLVMNFNLEILSITLIIAGFALVQIATHLIFFLDLKINVPTNWYASILLYMLMLILILIGASTFIMYHLKINMTML